MPNVELKSTTYALTQKLRNAAVRATSDNLLINGTMASPPTISVNASADAALTNIYTLYSGGAFVQSERLLPIGGVPQVVGGCIGLKSASIGAWGNIGSTALQTSVAWEFETDAPTLEFTIFPQNASQVRFAVAENGGKMQYIGGWSSLNSSTVTSYIKAAFGSSKQRRLRLEFGLKQGDTGTPAALLISVSTPPSYSIWRPNYAPVRIAWLSDSYMGTIAYLDYSQDNPGVYASHLLGAHGTMIAVGGTGYVNANGSLGNVLTRLDDLTQQSFDAVAVCLSTNDTGGAQLQANALSCFQGIRTRLPLAPVFVFGGWPKPNTPEATTLAVDADVKVGFDQWADVNSYWFPIAGDPAGNWMKGTTNSGAPGANDISGRYIGADGVHILPIGAPYYGVRLANKIKSAIGAL